MTQTTATDQDQVDSAPTVKASTRVRTRLAQLPMTARLAGGFIGLIVLVGVFAPLLTRHDPTAVGLAPPSQGPNGEFWFGVDRLGRDIYSRLVAGTRRSLIVGFGSVALALLAGSALGAWAATTSKGVDEVIMRCLDVIMAFPMIVLTAILVIAFGNGNLFVLVVAIGFVFTPQIARIVRANVQSQYGQDYVAAERVLGAGRRHILVRHVTRNCAAPVMVYVTIMVATAIVFEASLSFIGAGLQGPDGPSSWGSVIAYGQQLLQSKGWWATFFPGLLILLTVLALNLLAEGISDMFAAPMSAGSARVRRQDDPLNRTPDTPAEIVDLPGLHAIARRLATRQPAPRDGEPVLSVRDLRISFPKRYGSVDIVDGVGFQVWPGEVLGLVGESGCGKSLTALTVMGLQAASASVEGEIVFAGNDVVSLSAKERRRLMGTSMAMIYQDALSALNPAMTVSAQLKQLVRRGGTRTAEELLVLVGLDPHRVLRAYPHELSGGQRQRVVIAMALSRDPKLIIADEPTTALDVTVQAQVMRLLLRLKEQLGFALIFVSHDLALVSDVCDRVVVMYGGQIAETGAVSTVFSAPEHHYTRGLLSSVISLETNAPRLAQVPGVVPSPRSFSSGCRFIDRCPAATAQCHTKPPLTGEPEQHQVACFHPAPAGAKDSTLVAS